MGNSTSDPKVFVESVIASNKVAIFSKSYCPACIRTKKLFESLGQAYKAVELNEVSNSKAIADEVYKLTGKTTVPQVFVNGQRVGGCDDTFAAHQDGRLAAMLAN